jgi:DNA-binding CsgD family transcriptional regulator
MNALLGLRDPFALVVAAAAVVTLLALQEGPLVAILAALSVLVFRVAATPILDRWIRRPTPPVTAPPAPPIPPGRLWYHPLTLRESEVALLVTDGLTTPQIAERMVSERTVDGHVTEKTVETHIGNIMNKLSKELGRDVNRRTQISAWVTERRPREPVSRPSIPR